MRNATLLVVVGQAAKPTDLEPLSEIARAKNLHLSVLLLGAMPPIPVYTYGIGEFGSYAFPEGWQTEVDRANAALTEQRDHLAQYLSDQGVSADVTISSGEAASLPDAVARRALTCDLVVFSDDLRAEDYLFNAVIRATLFQAPAGVMLNALAAPEAFQPETVFVAWKAVLPAARAIREALPMLRAAKSVVVAVIDPVATPLRDGENPGTDVATWLSHQGCNVTVEQYPSGGKEIGTVMTERAKECGADLLVMGAYDHSRWREVVFGGTTLAMVNQRDMPVLLCH